ncbi:helix-turn-helix domain-containing protein [Actinophytocola gossypii]|uniref:Helix-turn-helix domain-containing protein n=1 Tax=Actinophytocola gossypii TaxID=2812003 RepID=A0ABT2JGR4_9PSEU|nr:helix-turn-helix transcriptional regulator [Actinophytocola gossypii]MCT2587075.1 helix-turn-helix domain-containing protein [Actinophytocola gossypii]
MTNPDPGPVVQRILIGAELRAARETRNVTSGAATEALGWYSGKLSKIEQGDMPISDKDLAKVVALLDIDDTRVDALRSLATEARRKLPPNRVPGWAAKYVHLFHAAKEVRVWNGDTFPGTVQTVDYARATLAQAVKVAATEVDRMAEDRAKRVERIMAADRPRLWVAVGEEALHREVGGRATLRAQLEHVRKIAELPNITIQVVPFAGGAHASHGVSFSITTLIEGRHGVVYLEGLSGSDYLGREHVGVYTLTFDHLMAAALSPRETMALLDRRIAEL